MSREFRGLATVTRGLQVVCAGLVVLAVALIGPLRHHCYRHPAGLHRQDLLSGGTQKISMPGACAAFRIVQSDRSSLDIDAHGLLSALRFDSDRDRFLGRTTVNCRGSRSLSDRCASVGGICGPTAPSARTVHTNGWILLLGIGGRLALPAAGFGPPLPRDRSGRPSSQSLVLPSPFPLQDLAVRLSSNILNICIYLS